MCHLSLEKLLKAIVTEVTQNIPPKSHNLIYLIKLSNIELPKELINFGDSSMVKGIQEINRIIEKFKKELEKYNIHSERIILYGSYAKGNAREDSDIDLVVISSDFENMNLRERLEILGLAAGNVLEPIEALGYTPQEVLEKKETFLEAII